MNNHYIANHCQSTIIVKVGTSSIVSDQTNELLLPTMNLIVEAVLKLRFQGHHVVLVSSGAVGVGLQWMSCTEIPEQLSKLQALAAIGQCRLISIWRELFSRAGLPIAQILLTRDDFAEGTRYINSRNTLNELFAMGVVPIVNENDTSGLDIKLGDNDKLSAITAAMIKADYLFLMTDVDCLYDANPRHDPLARAIEIVEDITSLKVDVSSMGSRFGKGGMSAKVAAARAASSAGIMTIITRSSNPGNIVSLVHYFQTRKGSTQSTGVVNDPLPLHTRFLPSQCPREDWNCLGSL